MSKSYDIDAIIDGVRSALPEVMVEQLHQSQPADDNGLWFFRLPDTRRDIQIESSTSDCPFLVEHSDMTSISERFTATSVSEAVAAVVSFLRSVHGMS